MGQGPRFTSSDPEPDRRYPRAMLMSLTTNSAIVRINSTRSLICAFGVTMVDLPAFQSDVGLGGLGSERSTKVFLFIGAIEGIS